MSQVLQPRYEWDTIPWAKVQRKVLKLQRRIYRASQSGNTKLVHRLQRLLVKSYYSRLLAVRRVTQENKGKKTAGIDGKTFLRAEQRIKLAISLSLGQTAQPLRRIWIPKPGKTEKRPLGIPVIADRALQALVKSAIEPEWEAKFERNSFGFRPGRSGHDAIEAIFDSIKQKPKFVLDADIAQCFDRINHDRLLAKIKTAPTFRRVIKSWLRAGVMDGEVFSKTTAGTPQGGVISPLLANIALHGMMDMLYGKYTRKLKFINGKNVYFPGIEAVRYADDFIVMHPEASIIQECQKLIQEWLQDIGLELKPEKTRIAHTLGATEYPMGFDFLGFSVQQVAVGKYKAKLGFKTLITPSNAKCRNHIAILRNKIKFHENHTQLELINDLNPVIRGWSRYYSTVVSTRAFCRVDNQLFQSLFAWAKRRHPETTNKPIVRNYWGVDKGAGWQFMTAKGVKLLKHTDSPIVRHVKVRANKSPFDGDWIYWASRRGTYPGTPKRVTLLLKNREENALTVDCTLAQTPILKSIILVEITITTNGKIWKRCIFIATTANMEMQGVSRRLVSHLTKLERSRVRWKLSRTVLKPSGAGDSIA